MLVSCLCGRRMCLCPCVLAGRQRQRQRQAACTTTVASRTATVMKPDNLSGSKSSSACCAGTRRQRAKRRSADVAVNPRRANFSGGRWVVLQSGVSSYGNLGAVFRPSSNSSQRDEKRCRRRRRRRLLRLSGGSSFRSVRKWNPQTATS